MHSPAKSFSLIHSWHHSIVVIAAALFFGCITTETLAQETGPTPAVSVSRDDGPTESTIDPTPESNLISNNLISNIDPASKPEESSGIPTHPVEIIEKMGGWLVPFLIASIISVWFTIERVVVLRQSRVIPRSFVEPFLDSLHKGRLDAATALSLCQKNDSPVSAVFLHGVQKWGRPSVEVEQAIIDGGERQIGQLRRHLRVLNGVATVTPLLGLLGTVVGMIQAFNDIASAGAMGKADQLAAGIAMALLTTAFGLAIAIPSLIMYMYLSGRVEALVMEMDELSQKVVRHVCAEGLVQAPKPPPKTRPRPIPSTETPEAVV
ncbi:MAG: MotA/TolQ/ExbB proton channel family protein [Planctomycetota bacterium]|nr:MotA/TolQ/ExbB proton channel family protein [Planctomycetota bacterium]